MTNGIMVDILCVILCIFEHGHSHCRIKPWFHRCNYFDFYLYFRKWWAWIQGCWRTLLLWCLWSKLSASVMFAAAHSRRMHQFTVLVCMRIMPAVLSTKRNPTETYAKRTWRMLNSYCPQIWLHSPWILCTNYGYVCSCGLILNQSNCLPNKFLHRFFKQF